MDLMSPSPNGLSPGKRHNSAAQFNPLSRRRVPLIERDNVTS
jgi:hypothetical protein